MFNSFTSVLRSQSSFIAAVIVALLTLTPVVATAAIDQTISSSTFEAGYGYTSPGIWNKSETNTANVPAGTSPTFTVGDFNVTITVTGGLNSSSGPGFPNRVLSSGGALTGLGTNFQVVASATYNGLTPIDADSPVNYRLRLEVDEISVYAHKHPIQAGGTDNTIQWFEIGGTGSNSGVFSAVQSTSFTLPADFTQVFWNPAEILSVGTTQSRTFQVTRQVSPGNPKEFMLDGFELIGRATLVYNAVPEPGAVSLLAAGAGLLLRRRVR